MDIVGGIMLADGAEAQVVTGVDDHSRHCVIAQVVGRATGRAVCLAFARGVVMANRAFARCNSARESASNALWR